MGITLKRPAISPTKDLKKDALVRRSLVGLSQRVYRNRKKEESALKLKKERELEKSVRDGQLAKLGKHIPVTTLRVNVRGNRSGMHNYGESEHFKKIGAMRKFYGKQMPVLQCGTCAYSTACPQFKAGYQCAFLPFLNSHKLENERDLVHAMRNMAEANVRRMHLATLMETLTGGAPSLETTEALAICFQQLTKLYEVETGAGRMEASIETNDGGVIAKIFGSLSSLKKDTGLSAANPIVADPIIRDDPDKPNVVDVASELIEDAEMHRAKDIPAGRNVYSEVTVSNTVK